MMEKGEAMLAGSPEHLAEMAELWRKAADRFAFVATAGRWAMKAQPLGKGLMSEESCQRIVEFEFRTSKPVVRFGYQDGSAYVKTDCPDLAKVLEDLRAGGAPREVAEAMVVQLWETAPCKPKVFRADGGENVLNLWTDPGIVASNVTANEARTKSAWFLGAVERFFGDDRAAESYFLDWCAHLIVRPDVKMVPSVLLTSKLHGAGKNFIGDVISRLVGLGNSKPVKASELKGNFQNWIAGTSLAVISEMYEGDDYKFADMLKEYQSETRVRVNVKYGPQETIDNFCHFLAFSNSPFPVRLQEDDRRWFIFASPQEKPWGAQEWDWRWAKMRDVEAWSDLRAFFEWRFLRRITNGRTSSGAAIFDPKAKPPTTEAKREVIDASRSAFFGIVRELLMRGEIAPGPVKLSEMLERCEGASKSFKRPPNGAVAADLMALGFARERSEGARHWIAPSLPGAAEPKPSDF